MTKITTLFLDIGGVILTNGWDRGIREKAIKKFHLEPKEFDALHKEYYDLHEQGKISLSTYLDKVVFWKKRPFSKTEFEDFMKSESQAYPEMIDLFSNLKKEYHLKVFAISNEGKELAKYRIHTYNLASFIDAFFISCFVGIQKPDPRFYEMALDITETDPSDVIYIDDRSYLIDAASKLHIKGIEHTSLSSTKNACQVLLSQNVIF